MSRRAPVLRTVLTQRSVVLGVALAGPGLASGEAAASPVNTERLQAAADVKGWSASLDATAGLRAGNVDRVDIGFGGGVQYRTFFEPGEEGARRFLRDRWLVASNIVLARANGSDITDSGFMHSRYTRMVWPRIGGEVFVQSQYNAFTRLRSRLLTGGGARFDVVHRAVVSVLGGTGYMAEHEVNATIEGDPHPARVVNHRWTSYGVVWVQLLEEQLALRTTVYAQPRLDDLGDARFLTDGQVEARVGPVFALGLEFELRYDSRPPAEIDALDLELRGYLRFRFG